MNNSGDISFGVTTASWHIQPVKNWWEPTKDRWEACVHIHDFEPTVGYFKSLAQAKSFVCQHLQEYIADCLDWFNSGMHDVKQLETEIEPDEPASFVSKGD